MNFFEMLVMSRKLSFVDGKVSLYGQDISIYPARSMMAHIGLINTDPESVKFVYSIAKKSILEHNQELKGSYNQSKGVNWIVNTINLYGLGRIEYNSTSPTFVGEIVLTNSPFVQHLKGKVNKPVDDVLRGIIAGMASSIFDSGYDVIETECEATGSTACKFMVDKKENLVSKFPLIYKDQVLS